METAVTAHEQAEDGAQVGEGTDGREDGRRGREGKGLVTRVVGRQSRRRGGDGSNASGEEDGNTP